MSLCNETKKIGNRKRERPTFKCFDNNDATVFDQTSLEDALTLHLETIHLYILESTKHLHDMTTYIRPIAQQNHHLNLLAGVEESDCESVGLLTLVQISMHVVLRHVCSGSENCMVCSDWSPLCSSTVVLTYPNEQILSILIMILIDNIDYICFNSVAYPVIF